MSTQWAAVPCYSSFPSAVKVDSSIRSDQRRRSAPDKVGERKQRERERERQREGICFFVVGAISSFLIFGFLWRRDFRRAAIWLRSSGTFFVPYFGCTPPRVQHLAHPLFGRIRVGQGRAFRVCWCVGQRKKKPIQRQFCCCLLPCYSLSRPVPSWTELRGKKPKCVYVREMVARFCASVGVLFNDGRIVVRISAAASQNGTSPKAAAERTKRRKKNRCQHSRRAHRRKNLV